MRGQPVWAATCLVTSIESLTTAEVARLEPDMRMARWNSWLEPWVVVRVIEASPPPGRPGRGARDRSGPLRSRGPSSSRWRGRHRKKQYFPGERNIIVKVILTQKGMLPLKDVNIIVFSFDVIQKIVTVTGSNFAAIIVLGKV